MEILLFLVLGLFVGTFGTLVGIGGGLICVLLALELVFSLLPERKAD